MAGAGYKLFNTGDVLTAAQVNTYLQEQTVMVFADATARTTALSGVLAEGMVTYLKSTKVVEIYNGTAWVSSDDPNAIQNTIVDAKGDLISATAADTPARLAVGNNGETLVADSSTSTGLRWGNNYGFTAGKNKIINGDFGIWQRGSSISIPNGTFTYGADRMVGYCLFTSGTSSWSQQTFTAGTAPVSGYEGTYFGRLTIASGASYFELGQKIESVRTFANQTVTLSFWAKSSASLVVTPGFYQLFGSGGSASVNTAGSNITLTTSWVRYTTTVSLPSISGKTIGTGDSLYAGLFYVSGTLGSATIDLWGFQVEAGSVATAFQTATGTLAGELAACQRYYWRSIEYPSTNYAYSVHGTGLAESTSQIGFYIKPSASMRTRPSTLDYASLAVFDGVTITATPSSVNLIAANSNANQFYVTFVKSGFTQFRPYFLINNNDAAGYIGFSAEL